MDNNELKPEEMPQDFNPEKPAEMPQELETAKPDEIEQLREIEQQWADKLGMDYNPEMVQPEEQIPADPDPAAANVQPDSLGADARPQPQQPKYEPMPPTCLIWAVLATICCCVPAGIVAIIFSSQVSTKYFARDFEGARRASDRAQAWIIAAIVLGIIINALYVPLSMLTAL